jgi:hypothetical protein
LCELVGRGVEWHVMLDVLRVPEEEVLSLVGQHEPPEGLALLVEGDAPVDLHGTPLGHLPGPVEDVARRLQGVAVTLGEDARAGDAPLRGVHAPVGVAYRAEPTPVLEHAVRVVAPLARVRVEHVLGKQLPALGRHHLQGLEDEGHLGLGHEVGEGEAGKARAQRLRVRFVPAAVALAAENPIIPLP